MKLFELDLNWANANNAEYRPQYERDEYTIVNANVEDVMKHAGSGFALDPHDETGGKNAIGNRLERAKAHFKAGGPMDLPIVGVTGHSNGATYISNGRHRMVAAFQLGHEYIPMHIYKSDLENFKKLVRTK